MKEIREILKTIDSLAATAKPVLATVVDVEGSSFRLPGAKMLILEDGTTVGTISGGCLESDVLERAAEVRVTGGAAIFEYDTTDNEDSVFSLNMGCRGIVRILLEPALNSHVMKFYRDNLENSRAGVVASRISGSEIGAQVIVDEAGVRHSGFGNPAFTQAVVKQADSVIREKTSRLIKIEDGEIFFEYVQVPIKLMIFGAGADAVPLADLANQIGWKTHIVDHRKSYANSERFPTAEMISNPRREKIGSLAPFGENTLAVVMTHNIETDQTVIAGLLPSSIEYVGVMGPKSRTQEILKEIEGTGIELTAEMREKVHGPVGLDIGATTPEGIALAIAAEIQTFLSGREGGFLKDRKGSIYGRD